MAIPSSEAATTNVPGAVAPVEPGGLAVLRNRPFLLLWLAQLSTQVGGNMVMLGLLVIITSTYSGSKIAISVLLLCFLAPAIIFSAIAGVFVDRVDKRLVLVVTNVLRGVAFVLVFLVRSNLLLLYLLMILVSTLTTFFGPAEASMIPFLVPRSQLLAANGLFALTTNAAFALGFALLRAVRDRHRRPADADPHRRGPLLRRRRLLLDPAVVTAAAAATAVAAIVAPVFAAVAPAQSTPPGPPVPMRS
jgi:MFS family permease